MLNLVIFILRNFIKIIVSPCNYFDEIAKNKDVYRSSAFLSFIFSAAIPLAKSFSMKMKMINFFDNEALNAFLSYCSTPQVQWAVIFLCFLLLVFLLNLSSRIFINKRNGIGLLYCFLCISNVGILLQVFFLLFGFFLPHQFMSVIWLFGFSWVVFLSILAINKCQKINYVKSIIVYLVGSLPIVLIAGLTGLAPFLLWAK